jgi:hypothetical protein
MSGPVTAENVCKCCVDIMLHDYGVEITAIHDYDVNCDVVWIRLTHGAGKTSKSVRFECPHMMHSLDMVAGPHMLKLAEAVKLAEKPKVKKTTHATFTTQAKGNTLLTPAEIKSLMHSTFPFPAPSPVTLKTPPKYSPAEHYIKYKNGDHMNDYAPGSLKYAKEYPKDLKLVNPDGTTETVKLHNAAPALPTLQTMLNIPTGMGKAVGVIHHQGRTLVACEYSMLEYTDNGFGTPHLTVVDGQLFEDYSNSGGAPGYQVKTTVQELYTDFFFMLNQIGHYKIAHDASIMLNSDNLMALAQKMFEIEQASGVPKVGPNMEMADDGSHEGAYVKAQHAKAEDKYTAGGWSKGPTPLVLGDSVTYMDSGGEQQQFKVTKSG